MRIQSKHIGISAIIIILLGAGLLSFPIAKNYINYYRLKVFFDAGISEKDVIYYEEDKKQDSYLPGEFNETSRLYYLCKVWGFVKYYHENDKKIKTAPVDELLISILPKVKGCTDRQEYRKLLSSLVDSIQISPLSGKNPYPDSKDYYLINNDWLEDTICLDKETKNKLLEIFHSHTGKRNNFIGTYSNSGNFFLKNEKKYAGSFPEEDIRLLGLFRFWNIINYFYVNKSFMDENWDCILYETITRFRNLNTSKEYHAQIHRLINILKDSHTTYATAVDSLLYGPYRPGFTIINVNDTFVVNKFHTGEKKGEKFKLGDRIIKIEGKNAKFLYDSLSVYLGGGNYWSQQQFICNGMVSAYDPQTRFTILRGIDTLKLVSENKTYMQISKEKESVNNEKRKKDSFRWINESIAYLDLNYLTTDNFKSNYKQVSYAKAIILDLRSYPEGSIIMDLIKAFVPEGSRLASFMYADTRFPGMIRVMPVGKEIGSKEYYKGQLVLLVSERTGSYGEYTAMALQANPKTKTAGYSSSGAVGNAITLDFPGGFSFWITAVGCYYPDMTATQRTGVKIDYFIHPTYEKIKGGEDFLLTESIEFTNNLLKVHESTN